jgi:hypothetical protein
MNKQKTRYRLVSIGKSTVRLFFIALVAIASVVPAFAADSYGDYPSPERMFAEIQELRDKYPEWVTVGEYGRSVKDRPLYYIRIAKPGGKERAEALIAANIHGNEWIGNRLAMAVVRRLLGGRESDPWIASLLDRIDFWILPCINPDGYFRTWEERGNDRVEWSEMRKNANGVDLNRNFPLPAERTVDMELAGSSDPDSIRYTGPYPYSEPETRAIRDFTAGRRFFAAIDFHSAWGIVFPPKCNGKPCEKQFAKLMAPAAERQIHLKYPVVMGWQVDSFSGEMEDMLFYERGAMAVCWEIFTGPAAKEQQKNPELEHPFWSMNPFDINYWIENDRDAALAAIEGAREVTGGEPIPEKFRQVKLK